MIRFFLFSFFMISLTSSSLGQNERQEYLNVITQRADKIVVTLGISDSVDYKNVRSIIVDQYDQLNSYHETVTKDTKSIKAKYKENKDKEVAQLKKADKSQKRKLDAIHRKFVHNLSKNLSKEQVEMIKDGMTYSVMPRTYVAYQEMIPSLNDSQKKFIFDALFEAREIAMDAAGSKEKHAVFGKYKGRINNYLSKEGYDLKKEGEQWEERIKNSKKNIM